MARQKLALGAVVTAAFLALTGCGGSDRAQSETSTVTETVTESTTTMVEQAAPWTEFGATVDDWNSAHEPDTRYAEGCCFLPGPKSAGGRYAALLSNEYKGATRVDGFSLFYDEPIAVDLARRVVKNAAPPQSRLASVTRRRGCLMLRYRSPALTRAFDAKAVTMLAALYSSADGPFNGRSVNDISFLSVAGYSLDC